MKFKSGIEFSTREEMEKYFTDKGKKEEFSKSSVAVLDEDSNNCQFSKMVHNTFEKTKSTLPSVEELKRLAELRGITWEEGYEERVIPYFASDERVDSYGDIVKQSWVFDSYEKNPVMPFSHNWRGLPIANALDWKVVNRKEADYQGPALWLLGLFPSKEVNEQADSIYRLIKSGFLKGGSVGFWAGKAIWIEDDKERAELGLGPWGYILEDNHLLEFSPTMLPANEGALVTLSAANQTGLLGSSDMNVIRDIARMNILNSSKDTEEWLKADTTLRKYAKTVFNAKLAPHEDLESPVVERIIKDSNNIRTSDPSKIAVLEAKVNELEKKHSNLLGLVETHILGNVDLEEEPVEILSGMDPELMDQINKQLGES